MPKAIAPCSSAIAFGINWLANETYLQFGSDYWEAYKLLQNLGH